MKIICDVISRYRTDVCVPKLDLLCGTLEGFLLHFMALEAAKLLKYYEFENFRSISFPNDEFLCGSTENVIV